MTYDAFILAAGLGTRLRPLTLHRPKPLMPVCGIPMLSYALALCGKNGLRQVLVNAHYLAEQLVDWKGEHEGVVVDVVVETPDILGTGGGLRAVRDRLASPFAVVNADVLTDVDLRALVRRVPARGATMALRRDPESPTYGIVAADGSATVVDLVGLARAEAVGETQRDTHFTGIHALDRDVLDLVPDGFACIVRSAYRQLVPQRLVHSHLHQGLWLDVGEPKAYLDANLRTLMGVPSLPLDPQARAAYAVDARGAHGKRPAGFLSESPVWVGHGAKVERVRAERAVIGAGAVIEPGTHLRDAVVWDGVTVPAGHYSRVIVHSGGVLQLPG